MSATAPSPGSSNPPSPQATSVYPPRSAGSDSSPVIAAAAAVAGSPHRPPSNEASFMAGSVPPELQRAASDLAASTASPTASPSRRRKKKKRPPSPPQLKKEPRGADEAEVRMLWNRVAPLQGNPMTTPAEPPMTYNNASLARGGLQDTLAVAGLTQALVQPPPNLVQLARGPMATFVAQGSIPKIGWVSMECMPPSFHDKGEKEPERGRRGRSSTSAARDGESSPREQQDDDDGTFSARGGSAGVGSAGVGVGVGVGVGAGAGAGVSVGASVLRSMYGGAALPELVDMVGLATKNKPPPVPGKRVANENVIDDNDALLFDQHLEECTKWMTDLATAVQNERHLFAQTKADLTDDIKQLELDRAKRLDEFEEKRTYEQQVQRSHLILRDDDLQKLLLQKEKVQNWLEEKRRILRELQDTSVAVEEAERSSTLKLLDVEEDYRKQRARLEEVLKNKLANAVDQMAQLSEAQRKARESSTVEDFARLANELTEQERKMRDLNSVNAKLQTRIAELRREISLETQRGQMLQQKQEGYHASISTLVHRLEEIERKYAAQSQRELKGISSSVDNNNNATTADVGASSASASASAKRSPSPPASPVDDENSASRTKRKAKMTSILLPVGDASAPTSPTAENSQLPPAPNVNEELPRVIDQQYAVILQLRADLVRVRGEVAQATEQLSKERAAVVQASNPSAQPIVSRVRVPQPPAQQQQQQQTFAASAPSNPRIAHAHATIATSQQNGVVATTANATTAVIEHHQQTTLPVDMRPSDTNLIRHVVFEALRDADKNLEPVAVQNSSKNSDDADGAGPRATKTVLPPVYPTLDVLTPEQRKDVFDFICRRINTRLLNPLQSGGVPPMSLVNAK